MSKKISLIFLISMVIALSACKKPIIPEITMEEPNLEQIIANGGVVKVSFNSSVPWVASSSQGWITISPPNGEAGDNTIDIIAISNKSDESRIAEITLTAETAIRKFNVTQKAKAIITIPEFDYWVTREDTLLTIPIQSNLDFDVTIDDESKEWITLSNSKALQTNNITLNIAANPLDHSRIGTLHIVNADNNISYYISINQDTELIEINDANFKTVIQEYDSNNNGWISIEEIKKITILNCCYREISSLEGIEKFTSLTELQCYGNYLTTLNVSTLDKLQILYCDNNSLTSLDVSANTNLVELGCGSNQLSSLDLTGLTKLKKLDCCNQSISSLDLSTNTLLESLDCNTNQLSSLSLSATPLLKNLYCSHNELSSLNLSSLTHLEDLYCEDNLLTSLSFEGLSELSFLECGENQIESLDLTPCTSLGYLSADDNKLTSLILTACTELSSLNCQNNLLTSLNLTNNTKTTQIDFSNNKITSIDLSHNIALYSLFCEDNLLTALDLSQITTSINILYCKGNKFEHLDIRYNTKIFALVTEGSPLLKTITVKTGKGFDNLQIDEHTSMVYVSI